MSDYSVDVEVRAGRQCPGCESRVVVTHMVCANCGMTGIGIPGSPGMDLSDPRDSFRWIRISVIVSAISALAVLTHFAFYVIAGTQ